MAKLYFKYGTMDASKSADLLMTAHKYENQGKNIICLRSSLDTRTKKDFIESRALTYKHSCFCFDKDTNLFDFINNKNNKKINCILIDEAQFLTKEQVIQLTEIVDFLNTLKKSQFNENTYYDKMANEKICKKCFLFLYKYIEFYSNKKFKTIQTLEEIL